MILTATMPARPPILRAEVRPMAVADYEAAVRSGLPWPTGPFTPSPAKVAEACTASGPCYAGFLDGVLLGVAGVRIPWAGLGEGWAVLTEDGRKHGRIFHRAARDGFRQIVRDYQLRRVQAWVEAENLMAVRWAMAFGFEAETPRLKGYGPHGQAFVLFTHFPN
jgi:hypothetical protein